MDYRRLITIEPGKRAGEPCIRGMRITVYDVLDHLASGMTEEEIPTDFPDLTRDEHPGLSRVRRRPGAETRIGSARPASRAATTRWKATLRASVAAPPEPPPGTPAVRALTDDSG